ncbi:hypothetical protein A2U01_0086532, partial [Trifolium medium]|nr:hypothetical protein [Trifolium medium]
MPSLFSVFCKLTGDTYPIIICCVHRRKRSPHEVEGATGRSISVLVQPV